MHRPTLDEAREALRRHFGYDDFRPGQDEIIQSVLEGRHTIAVMPTGGGKSICYQIPAVLLPGLTIVVSPLISLMHDQVDALARARIRGTFINSMLDYREATERIERARSGEFRLMYVAPERFESTSFLERMRGIRIALFAVDEAHCISEWGHDFRPSYTRLKDAVAATGTPQVIALTATATPDVREDIRRQLGLESPALFVRGFDRPNLSFRVMTGGDKRDVIARTASSGDCGIVYAGTRGTVEELALMLQRRGIRAEAYHAGLPDELRRGAQDRFMSGATPVIVATNAFGMGIDKRDVRFVIHHDMPGTIEQYYQEAGRAGRDGAPSTCILLYQPSDRQLPEFFIRSAAPDRALVQNVYVALHNAAGTELGQRWDGLLSHTPDTLAPQLGNASETSIRAALDVLERSGYIRRINARYGESTIRYLLDHERMRVWMLESASPVAQRLMAELLRALGGAPFHDDVVVAIEDLAARAEMAEDDLVRGLRALHAERIIAFRSGRASAGIALPGSRVAARDLQIDFQHLQRRMRHQLEKLQAMERYILGSACRRNLILEYFDERDVSGVCGRCDTCTSTVISFEESPEDAFDRWHAVALRGIAELGGRFGRTTVIDVLRGAKNKRIAQFALHRADCYGRARDADKDAIGGVLDTLIGLGWAARTDSQYPALAITEVGRGKLDAPVVPLDLPASGEQAVRDPVLYEALRAVRRRAAGRHNIPSHVLMTDAVLRRIVELRPDSDDALLAVEGMGPVTVRRCGADILRAIAAHREQEQLAQAIGTATTAAESIPPSLRPTLELCAQGLGIADIAARRSLSEGTVSQHISELLERGVRIPLERIVPPAHQAQIRGAVDALRAGDRRAPDLKRVKAMIDDDISYGEIRVMLGLLARERGIREA